MGSYVSLDLTLRLKGKPEDPMILFLEDLCTPMELVQKNLGSHLSAEDHYHYLVRTGGKVVGNADWVGMPRWSTVFWGDAGIRYEEPTIRQISEELYELRIRGGVKNHQAVIERFFAWIGNYLDHKPGEKLGEWTMESWDKWADILYGDNYYIHYKYADSF